MDSSVSFSVTGLCGPLAQTGYTYIIINVTVRNKVLVKAK